MIYLIGGPPRSGKTTLAKYMSKKLGIPWISCDTLESVSTSYMSAVQYKKTHPYSVLRDKTSRHNDRFYAMHSAKKIVSVLNRQAKATFPAIDAMTICEITDGNDYIIEGYHIEPRFVARLMKKYGAKNIRAIFLTKFDAEKFAQDVKKSTTPNDWLLVRTKKDETFLKVGKMVAEFSRVLDSEAKKYGFKSICMDQKFEQKLKEAVKITCV